MGFVQIIEFTTDRFDEVKALDAEWQAATGGRRTATRQFVGRDRDRENTFWVVVEFPSFEDARTNDALPETQAFAEKMMKLASSEPTFINLDVVSRADL